MKRMSSEIVRHLPPEEQELGRRRQELATLQGELTDRELLLANLRAELSAFEGRYLREVGVLYAELDDWDAKIAEFTAQHTRTDEARAMASKARAQADESYAAAHGEAANVVDFLPSPELKKLFKDVVNQIHPDRAADDADRALRNRLMAEANAAYRRQDAEAMKRILEYKSSPESVKGEGAAADLERVLREIERITRRLAAIDGEVANLKSSEIALLMAKVETAKTKGRDLLAEMRLDVQHRIKLAREEFEGLCSEARGR
jgi:hypothetical protein